MDPGAVADDSGSSVLLPRDRRHGDKLMCAVVLGPDPRQGEVGSRAMMAQEIESSQLAPGMHDTASRAAYSPPHQMTDGMSAPSSDSRSLALSGLEPTCLCCISLPGALRTDAKRKSS